MNVLVTGVNGFVGHHLAKELHYGQKMTVVGCGMDDKLKHELSDYVNEYYRCDLTDMEAVKKLPLEHIDAVINLAGLAQVGASFGQAEAYMRVNVAVHTNIAERVKQLAKGNIRLLSISSGAVYDNNQPMPLRETSNLATNTSPYALSKIAMEKVMQSYREAGLDVIIARPFNHIGPGQAPGFLVPDLAQQLLNDNAVVVGNLETRRDYTDVRDVVKAYALLVTTKILSHDTYNICSAHSVSGEEVLDILIAAAGKDRSDITVKIDPAKVRPNDFMDIVGDNSRLKTDTGWQPTTPLEQTIRDFVSTR